MKVKNRHPSEAIHQTRSLRECIRSFSQSVSQSANVLSTYYAVGYISGKTVKKPYIYSSEEREQTKQNEQKQVNNIVRKKVAGAMIKNRAG